MHLFRTGRAYWWLFIILFFPVLGCLIYFFVEILPDLRGRGGSMASDLARAVDPGYEIKRWKDELAAADTVQNRTNLAREYLRAGQYEEALALYEKSLGGIYKDDPRILLGLAEAQFHLRKYDRVKETLDRLAAAHPESKSPEGHLLYARALEELGERDAAFEEYRVLAGYYPGVEAKCRYALLLKQAGQTDEARALFNDIVLSAKKFRRFYRGEDKYWVKVARENLEKP